MTEDPQYTPLELLGAFARGQADRLRAEAEAADRERREHEAHEAALGAANEFIQRFTVKGIQPIQPPALKWTGYASDRRQDQPPYRIQAITHLGDGVFLAYNRPRTGDDFGNHVYFTLVAADHPDDSADPGPAGIRDITELAEAITRIETARRTAAVTTIRSEIQ